MAQPIQIAVVQALLFSATFGWNHDLYPSGSDIGNDFVSIITPVSQQRPCGYSLYQVNSFFAIRSGTLCNQYSDRHTICIHGKVKLGVEPPFVRLMS